MIFPPTDWLDFVATEYEVGAPATSLRFERWFRNPVAIAQGAAGAPYVVAGWHPVGGVTVGDGATGLLYDFAVHGSVASVESATFANDFEYMFLFDAFGNSGAPSRDLRVEFYRETSASYTPITVLAAIGGAGAGGYLEITRPMRVSRLMVANNQTSVFSADSVLASTGGFISVKHTTAQKVSKVRFSLSVVNVDQGKVFAYRRKVY